MTLKRTSADQVYKQLIEYEPSSQVKPRPKEMEVLVVGLSRTGTMSMYVALRSLGINTYHFLETRLNRANSHQKLWIKALQAKLYGKGKCWNGEDLDQILWDYQAVTDAPCCLFADELIAAHPKAKVILTIRDEDAWVRSMDHSFLDVLRIRGTRLLEILDREIAYTHFPLLRMMATFWGKGNWQDTEALKQSFNEHNEHIRAIVPKDRLLEFRLGDGWEPLCTFLGRPIPSKPFPHANEGSIVVKGHHALCRRQWQSVGRKFSFWAVMSLLVAGAAIGIRFDAIRRK